MRSRIVQDAAGAEVLVREGTGVIDGIEHLPDGLVRIDIAVDTTAGRPRAMRVTARAMAAADSPAARAAQRAIEEMSHVGWLIEWHRHEWVPARLGILDLDLATDTVATLVEVHLASGTAERPDAATAVPDTVPAHWSA